MSVQIHDISMPLTPDVAVFPGDTPPTREMLLDMQQGDHLTLSIETIDNLRELVGYKHFNNLGTSVLRARGDSHEVQAEITLGDGLTAGLTLKHVSTEGQQIGIQNVRFQLVGRPCKHMIETSTSVTMGEYTVLGAFGQLPYFLVIRASSVK